MLLSRIIPACLLPLALLQADEIVLRNGQVLEGSVLEETDTGYIIGMNNGRARVKLSKQQVAEVRETTDLQDSSSEAEADSSFRHLGGGGHSYSTVQILGPIGTAVTASGVSAAIRHAQRKHAGSIVFVIDSSGPGDVHEALAIGEVLARYRPSIQIDVLIRTCLDGALVFPLYAHNVRIMPGGKVGTTQTHTDDEDMRVARREMGHRIAHEADRLGKPAHIFQAMIDPQVELAIWQTADGVQEGPSMPATVPASDLIVSVNHQERLLLTSDHFTALGLPPVANAEELQASIGQSGWQDLGTGAQEAMLTAQKRQSQRTEQNEARLQRQIDKITQRRQTAEAAFVHALQLVENWKPESGSYKSMNDRVSGWGWHYNSGRMSSESRKKWTARSDFTLRALEDALAALSALDRVEAEAERNNMDRNYTTTELANLRQELLVRYAAIKANRTKREL